MKAKNDSEVKKFTDIPNIGKAMELDFILIGIKNPLQLKTSDAYDLYERLCIKTNVQQDPCVLDTFLAAIDFMNGGIAKPWWHYTKIRKEHFLKK